MAINYTMPTPAQLQKALQSAFYGVSPAATEATCAEADTRRPDPKGAACRRCNEWNKWIDEDLGSTAPDGGPFMCWSCREWHKRMP